MGEAVEVGLVDLAGTQAADIDAMPCGNGTGAVIRRRTDMPATGAGGIEMRAHTGSRQAGTKGAFGHRRAADVAKADEQQGWRFERDGHG